MDSVNSINVIGHLSSPSGLGNTARVFIDLLRRQGYEVAGFDIEPRHSEEAPALVPGMLKKRFQDLPFDHNLIIASINWLPQLWLRYLNGILSPRFKNAGMLFWELPVIPAAWVPSLKMFDVVLVCSHYVRQTFESAIPEVPTVFAEHPLKPAGISFDRDAARRRYGIPIDKRAFCCGFDLVSGVSRKNPAGAVEAWTRAFPDDLDVCLVVKLNGNVLLNQHQNDVNDLLTRVQADSRIILVNERLAHDELMRLYDCCDVFVSLHRSEGLGLIPMEAMSLGKLVVATGYSGNMTFMTEQNSLPVPYRLIEPTLDRSFLTRQFAGPKAVWADPDLAAAARLLRMARDQRMADPIAEKARLDIAARQQTAWRGGCLEQMTNLLHQSDRTRFRPKWRREILANEIFDATLRRKNIETVVKRFRAK